ncbi:MAG: four helix bundle protein [Chloroflexi bacterium]|nr:four helix bundle protein [Chloroflexota bacterium]
MPLADLRTFLQQLDALGDLKVMHEASHNLEIGVITELSLQHDGPALLFDQIPGYPPGYRIASNVCSTAKRTLLALGLDTSLTDAEAMAALQKRLDAYKPVPPVVVNSGPVLENIQTGDEIDLTRFPVPIWHELDGAPYIGTGHAVIQQDPESGFVNVGTYRGQLHDRRTTGIFFTLQSKDGSVIMRKYWAQGKACPVAISYGPEPLLFLSGCSSNGIPPGTPEYEYTGFLAGEPVPVIRGNVTGLPIPANSEIAIEGEIPPTDEESRDEGPFGEWYVASSYQRFVRQEGVPLYKVNSEECRVMTGIVERSIDFSLRVIRLYRAIEKDGVGRVLGGQLLRAGTSVGANIHESQGAQSRADFIAKMSIAHKEARESAYWLRLIQEAGLLPASDLADLADETNQLVKILSSIILTSKANAKPRG